MNLLMRIVPGANGARGRCRFRSKTASLFYDTKPIVSPESTASSETPLLVSVINKRLSIPEEADYSCWVYYGDSLALLFSGTDRLLARFDAHENLYHIASCKPAIFGKPKVCGSGALQLLGQGFVDNRATGGPVHSFEYCAKENIVRYKLSSNPTKEHWLAGTGIIVGVSGSELTELYFCDLLVE